MESFDGKVAIVTGAANGIGAATARTLAERGASVVIADINAEQGEARAESIREAGLTCVSIPTDVGDEPQIEALVAKTVAEFGRLDVLHNNAAALELVGEDTEVTSLDLEIWQGTLRTNLLGPMLGCKHGIPAMLESDGGGSIVNTSSISGQSGELNLTAYGIAKAGVSQLTRAVATQWSKRGIRCNAVAPGIVVTDNVRANVEQSFIDVYVRNALTTYPGEAQDIANCVAFLASDEARYVTGTVLRADGGMMSVQPIVADFRLEGDDA
jgi:NAD(P)-dependent dehydrogenase (short-subunit alcohol dehydrogenase family)